MITTLLISGLVIVALSVVALLSALRNAPVGYEDENGFHAQPEKAPVPALVAESPTHLPQPAC